MSPLSRETIKPEVTAKMAIPGGQRAAEHDPDILCPGDGSAPLMGWNSRLRLVPDLLTRNAPGDMRSLAVIQFSGNKDGNMISRGQAVKYSRQ